jgi:hypothetical protein
MIVYKIIYIRSIISLAVSLKTKNIKRSEHNDKLELIAGFYLTEKDLGLKEILFISE